MILDPAKPVRWVPPGQDHLPEDKRAAFLLKAPTRAERVAIDRAIAGAGGVRVGPLDILAAAATELARPFKGAEPDGEAGPAIAAIFATQTMFREHVARFAGRDWAALPPDEQAALVDESAALESQMAELQPVFDALATASPAFKRKRGDAAVYPTIRRIELLRALVLGAENLGFDPKRGAGGLTDESLDRLLDTFWAPLVAAELERLLAPDAATRKNSPSPSPAGGGQATGAIPGTQPPTAPSSAIPSPSPNLASAD